MTVQNEGDAPDKLVAARAVHCGEAVIHADPARIIVPHGVMNPAHAAVAMGPGRPYVALGDPAQPGGPRSSFMTGASSRTL